MFSEWISSLAKPSWPSWSSSCFFFFFVPGFMCRQWSCYRTNCYQNDQSFEAIATDDSTIRSCLNLVYFAASAAACTAIHVVLIVLHFPLLFFPICWCHSETPLLLWLVCLLEITFYYHYFVYLFELGNGSVCRRVRLFSPIGICNFGSKCINSTVMHILSCTLVIGYNNMAFEFCKLYK